MASSGIEVGSVLVLMTVLCARAMAQSGCTNVLIRMVPCLNYVTGSSSTPTSSCCSSLASVVQSQPQCLCTALNGGGAALGISINQTLALALHGACNVKTPPVSLCDGLKRKTANGPGMSPVGSPDSLPAGSPESLPADRSNESPGSPTSTSVSGSKAAPADGATSGGSTIKTPFLLVAILLTMASYASTFSSF